MNITDVRIKLVNDSTDRLKAFCSVTLDEEFVIRDIKLVTGTNGLFVAMPSRKLTASCPGCRHKNPLRARHCNECGGTLPNIEVPSDDEGRAKLYRDIAHPITSAFREMLQNRVIEAYKAECKVAADEDVDPLNLDDADSNGNTSDREPSEYDTLIAGMKADSQRAPGDRRDSADRGRPQGRRGPDRDSSGDRRQRRRRGRSRSTDPPERTARPSASDSAAEPSSASTEVTESEDAAVEADVAAAIADTPAESSARPDDAVSLSDTAEEPSKLEATVEDTTAFGAGII